MLPQFGGRATRFDAGLGHSERSAHDLDRSKQRMLDLLDVAVEQRLLAIDDVVVVLDRPAENLIGFEPPTDTSAWVASCPTSGLASAAFSTPNA